MTNLLKILFLSSIILFAALTSFSQTPVWHTKFEQLVVLKSDRADFDRLFSELKIKQRRAREGTETIIYDLDGNELEISYSLGNCAEKKDPAGWDIKAGTIVRFFVYLSKPVKFSALKLNLKDFKKEVGFYFNYRTGMTIHSDKKTISAIGMNPTDAQSDKYFCGKLLKN